MSRIEENIPRIASVDVHVERVALLTGIAKEGAGKNEIRSNIIAACRACSVSPLLFNQGAWFISYFHPEELRNITSKVGTAKKAVLIKKRSHESD
jgi:hypothetical protein